LFTVAVGVLAFSTPTASAGRADGRLDIYWIDVEGGAATLIVTPQGESVLIDTGNPGHRDPDRIVKTAAHEAGLRQLDHVIITHYHAPSSTCTTTASSQASSIGPTRPIWKARWKSAR
jgi:glyoxylase-like metal-dependent hydrolase (beta-lactamase superfamily II)